MCLSTVFIVLLFTEARFSQDRLSFMWHLDGMRGHGTSSLVLINITKLHFPALLSFCCHCKAADCNCSIREERLTRPVFQLIEKEKD